MNRMYTFAILFLLGTTWAVHAQETNYPRSTQFTRSAEVSPQFNDSEEAEGAVLGEVRLFAGAKAPAGWAFCNGQSLDVAKHKALYRVLGKRYGGDGTTTFHLPDLRGLLVPHPERAQKVGHTHDDIDWEYAYLEVDEAGLQKLKIATKAGQHPPTQPYLLVNYMICVKGESPSAYEELDGALGEIRLFAGEEGRIPENWMPCNGRFMKISTHKRLFDAIGSTFGGDNASYFNLPDLRGRIPLQPNDPTFLGQNGGDTTLANKKDLFALADTSFVKNYKKALKMGSNLQASMALNYIICTKGDKITKDINMRLRDGIVGEIRLWAMSFTPQGWTLCNGRELNIPQHPKLFDVLGETFGGDGALKFNLPDFRMHAPIHQGGDTKIGTLGQQKGTKKITGKSYESAQLSEGWGSKAGVLIEGKALNNLQPYLTLNFILCQEGKMPQ